MNITNLLENAQFVVDAAGNQSAVLISQNVWEELLIILEDLEDAEEMKLLQEQKQEAISWQQAKVELGIENV